MHVDVNAISMTGRDPLQVNVMSRSKLEIVNARLSRGEELRLTFMLAALRNGRQVEKTRKSSRDATRSSRSLERLAA